MAVLLLILAFLSPLFYVLSVGPASWLIHHGYLQAEDGSLLVLFYLPLEYLAENVPVIEQFFEFYMSLWR